MPWRVGNNDGECFGAVNDPGDAPTTSIDHSTRTLALDHPPPSPPLTWRLTVLMPRALARTLAIRKFGTFARGFEHGELVLKRLGRLEKMSRRSPNLTDPRT